MHDGYIAPGVRQWPRLFLAALLTLAAASGVGRAQPNIRLDDVLKAWEERQSQAKSLRVEWTEDGGVLLEEF